MLKILGNASSFYFHFAQILCRYFICCFLIISFPCFLQEKISNVVINTIRQCFLSSEFAKHWFCLGCKLDGFRSARKCLQNSDKGRSLVWQEPFGKDFSDFIIFFYLAVLTGCRKLNQHEMNNEYFQGGILLVRTYLLSFCAHIGTYLEYPAFPFSLFLHVISLIWCP